MPTDVWYILLTLGLFLLPQLLERLRIPTAITSLGIGVLCGIGFGLFRQEPTLSLLSLYGIVALFLCAGLEVELRELRPMAWLLAQHIAIRVVSIGVVAAVLVHVLPLSSRAAIITALALLTPSTGFILSSLPGFGLSAADRQLVKAKAIAAELLALTALVGCTQSSSLPQLAWSGAALAGLVLGVPVAIRVFVWALRPQSPRTSFAFLLVLAILCASATHWLGAYYLLGAFLTGALATRARRLAPQLVTPRILDAVELFAAFFIPFYFFHAGAQLTAEDFSPAALACGSILIAGVLPLRVLTVLIHRRVLHGIPWSQSTPVATALLPTLVFTLVLTHILRDLGGVPEYLLGGLVLYALVSTILPAIALRSPRAIDFTTPALRPTEALPAPKDVPLAHPLPPCAS